MTDHRKRKLHSRRTWLNRSTRLRAHIIGHVTHESWVSRDGGKIQSVDGTLIVSDCDRVVTLDFDVYSGDDTADTREKVQRLRRSVDDFCDAMDRALDLCEADA